MFLLGAKAGVVVLFKITRCAFGERALTSVGRIMHCCDLLLVVAPSLPLPGARHHLPPPTLPGCWYFSPLFVPPCALPKIPAVFCSGDVAEAITGVYTNHTGE